MSKRLRPRRGAEDAAVQEDILLEEGELFMEFQSDRGEGFGPGRLIVGNGTSRYNEKSNVTDSPSEFQPFITDPQIYVPLYDDTEPQPQDPEKYGYEDSDRGFTKLKEDLLMGIRKLPETIGIIKEVLCRHTDNLRYDNDRIIQLQEQVKSSNILDIQPMQFSYHNSAMVRYFDVSVSGIGFPDGYEFYRWETIATPDPSSAAPYLEYRLGFVDKPFLPETRVYCTNRYFPTNMVYNFTYYIIKKKPAESNE